MEAGFSEDQNQFRDVVRRFLGDKSQPADVRRLMATDAGYDPAVWQQLCSDVGLAGTHLPEEFGGFGFGPVELGIACEELGRSLFCGPFFASAVMAAHAILLCGSDQARRDLLPGIADGSQLAALVLDDLNAPESVGGRVRLGGGALDGAAPMVIDAHNASLLVVVAGSDDGLRLVTVDPAAEGVAIELRETIDATRKLCSVAFSGTPASVIDDGSIDLSELWRNLASALAHEMIGGATAQLDSTLEYMKLRVQFGRPIGSFQALKHRCADLLLEIELAKAATHYAARVLASGGGDPWAPYMAKSLANEAAMSMAKQAIQLRGGIGFTWEEDTHLWFKRAKSSEVLLGGTAWHREAMLKMMEQEEAA